MLYARMHELLTGCIAATSALRNLCRGDPSHEFRLATFLPEVLQPPADQVLAICDKCIPLQHATQASQAGYVPGSNPLPGSDSAEATRRRQVQPVNQFVIMAHRFQV